MERVHGLMKVVVVGWLLVVALVSYAAVEEVSEKANEEALKSAEKVKESSETWTEWAKERIPSFSGVSTDQPGTVEKAKETAQDKSSVTMERLGSTKDRTVDAAAKAFESAKQKAGEVLETAKSTVSGQTKEKSEAAKETTSEVAGEVGEKLKHTPESVNIGGENKVSRAFAANPLCAYPRSCNPGNCISMRYFVKQFVGPSFTFPRPLQSMKPRFDETFVKQFTGPSQCIRFVHSPETVSNDSLAFKHTLRPLHRMELFLRYASCQTLCRFFQCIYLCISWDLSISGDGVFKRHFVKQLTCRLYSSTFCNMFIRVWAITTFGVESFSTTLWWGVHAFLKAPMVAACRKEC